MLPPMTIFSQAQTAGFISALQVSTPDLILLDTIFHWLWQWQSGICDLDMSICETIKSQFSKMLKFGHTNWWGVFSFHHCHGQLQASCLKIECLTIFKGSIQQLTSSCLYVMNAVIHQCGGAAENFIFLLFLHWCGSKVIKNKKSWSRVTRTCLIWQKYQLYE